LGVEPEILAGVRPAPLWRVWRSFLEPVIDAAGVETVLGDLAPSLAEGLERDGQGARRLALTGFRTDGRTTALTVALSRPSAHPGHLARVLKERGLEHLDLGFGIDALMLSAEGHPGRPGPLFAARRGRSPPGPGRPAGPAGRPAG
ncbi:MAG: hypothetical protein EBS42_08340, partial [Caulobacteraceae bacterium]|nr:hypothetical protein [Caulobacteraceae bacterium]